MRAPAPEDALAGARAQYALLADAMGSLPDSAFKKPTRLYGWTVAELVAHIARTGHSVARRAEAATSGTPERDVLDYLSGMSGIAPQIEAAAKETASKTKPAALRADVVAAGESVAGAEAPLGAVVPGYEGTLTFGDFLITRCVEGVVHGLDLRHAAGVPEQPDPTALKVAIRILAALVERAAPGKAVEVRVPGHVAFQCLAGPKHTRGTPGNVVECDPLAFLEVAAGRRTWHDAVSMGAIRGSGPRADLTEYLPVIG